MNTKNNMMGYQKRIQELKHRLRTTENILYSLTSNNSRVEVIDDRHRNGKRWLVFNPGRYGWEVGYFDQGMWMHDLGNLVMIPNPTYVLPLPPDPLYQLLAKDKDNAPSTT